MAELQKLHEFHDGFGMVRVSVDMLLWYQHSNCSALHKMSKNGWWSLSSLGVGSACQYAQKKAAKLSALEEELTVYLREELEEG